jgi:hypothetical protein
VAGGFAQPIVQGLRNAEAHDLRALLLMSDIAW